MKARKRFKDGRRYEFVTLALPRAGYQMPKGWGLTVRHCPAGSKETGATWQDRRHRLNKEAKRLIRWKNRLITLGVASSSYVNIGGQKMPLGRAEMYMSDWLKMAATGKPKRRKVSDRAHWLAISHPRDGRPGHRSEAA
tara:strand:- start:304 stop:720 length:417 start_codon:yes stop_codon:yes gene_type:complete